MRSVKLIIHVYIYGKSCRLPYIYEVLKIIHQHLVSVSLHNGKVFCNYKMVQI